MLSQPKYKSTIIILQTLIGVRKATHRRARSVLSNSLDDIYCVIIKGMWKHTSGQSVRGFLYPIIRDFFSALISVITFCIFNLEAKTQRFLIDLEE